MAFSMPTCGPLFEALKAKPVSQYQPAAPPLTHYKPVATKAVYHHQPPPVTHHVGYSHELPYAIPIVLKHSYPCEPKKKEDRKYFCHCLFFLPQERLLLTV